MTRSEFAATIRWPLIFWGVGIVNAVAMIPQLIQILKTGITLGLSIPMFVTYLGVQIAFSIEGYFKRNLALLYTVGVAAAINALTICSLIYFRYAVGS